MKHFLQFDFWNEQVNKFYFGVVEVDLNEVNLVALCRQLIGENFTAIDPNMCEIKVNAFNNLEI